MIQNSVNKLEAISLETFLKKDDPLALSRREYKFIVPREFLEDVLDFLKTDFLSTQTDGNRIFQYSNTYFDTKDYRFFNWHRQEKYNRIKVRIREYQGGNHKKFLECKEKIKGVQSLKHRFSFTPESNTSDLIKKEPIADKLRQYKVDADELINQTSTSYSRLSLIGKKNKMRATIDFDIFAENKASSPVQILPNHFILEIKSKTFPKTIADFLKKKYKIQESGFSKYCISLCHLEKGLKKNKWKQILKKYSSIHD